MGPAMRVLSRVVREFATGVDAGNAVRLGLPVHGDVPRDSPRDGAARDASAAEAAAATTVASGRWRSATSRARA